MRVVEYPRGLWQPRHIHDDTSVTLVLSGRIEEHHRHKTEYALPFSVIVKTPGVPHSDRFGPEDCKTLQVKLSADFDLSACEILPGELIWHNNGGPAIASLLRLFNYVSRTSGESESFIVLALYETLAALPSRSRLSGTPPAWVGEIKELIDASSALHPLSMTQLQKHITVHPVHITRQFKRQFGCTIRSYMQYRRIRAAVSFVADSSLSLTQIAHQCAFADQSHFCRAFRNIAKLSARDYRRLTNLWENRKS